MRCSTTGPMRAKRVARFAGAVALAGLSAACSADMTRFGPATTGSTGGSYGAAQATAPTAVASSDGVQRSQIPPAGGGAYSTGAYQTGAYRPANTAYTGSTGGYASAPASAPVQQASYSAPATGGAQVTVRPGQTLYAVARENGVSVNQLVAVNGLTPPYAVKPGQVLRLPSGNTSSASTYGGGATGIRSAPAVAAAATASASGSHVVKPGETLYSLGRAYNVSPATIASLNGYSMDYQLKVGESVRIPGSGSSTAAATTGTKVASLDPNPPASATPAPGPSTLGQIPAKGASTSADMGASSTAPQTSKAAAAPAAPPPASAANNFRWPVKGRVISKYGDMPNGARNDGINIAVPEGTSVRAAENGVVAYAGSELKGYGNLVLIRHEGGWVTAYAHNKELLVKRGDQIKRGDVIAKAGATGSVSSPQVHFEIRKGAQAVDPMSHLGSTYVAGD
ncbi:peptidoglycan DD-metalloendopeptidase family protein [Rhodoligotrophos ferricapiens]|uniref:peptidoglycan DD-metalloendopeptidase family protein n=1 Tax=Rhodoligotrophos ferricapiens TaxID=3069264 RepID=UPI00315DF336